MSRLMGPQDAESIAIRGLGFLAADSDRLGRFLAVTGLGPDNLRSAAGDPGFLASVLDYIASDEALILSLAAELHLKPERIADARKVLAGPPAFEH